MVTRPGPPASYYGCGMAEPWSQNQLTVATEAGLVDTIILAFTDHYGRLMGKRLDTEFFLSLIHI